MPYRTKSGTHYHTTLGCCKAMIPCGEGECKDGPCSRCANKDSRIDRFSGGSGSSGAMQVMSDDDLDSPAKAQARMGDFDDFKRLYLDGNPALEGHPSTATTWEEYYEEQRRLSAESDDATENQLITRETLEAFVAKVGEAPDDWVVSFHDMPVSSDMRRELTEIAQSDRERLRSICDQVHSVMEDADRLAFVDPLAQGIARRLRWRRQSRSSGGGSRYSEGELHIVGLLGDEGHPQSFTTADGRRWDVLYSPPEKAPAKPKTSSGSGSPKTDVCFTAVDEDGNEKLFTLSLKQNNAAFVENKIQGARAEQLFGAHLTEVLQYLSAQLPSLVTEKNLSGIGTKNSSKGKTFRTLGFTIDLINQPKNGYTVQTPMDEWDLPVDTEEMRRDIVKEAFSGSRTREGLRNATVNGVIVPNSGVAEYLLIEGSGESFLNYSSIQDVMDRITPIDEYVDNGTQLFFKFHPINDYSTRSEEHYSGKGYELFAYVDWAIGDDGYEIPTLKLGNPFEKRASDVHRELFS